MSPDFDALYRRESRRVLATLIRLVGDFDLAEEAMAEAFRAAIEQWPREGVPANPRAWLVSAGRFKAIDAIRRQERFSYVDPEALEARSAEPADAAADGGGRVGSGRWPGAEEGGTRADGPREGGGTWARSWTRARVLG